MWAEREGAAHAVCIVRTLARAQNPDRGRRPRDCVARRARLALRLLDDGIRPEWLVPAAEQGESFAYALSKQTPTSPSAVKQGRVPGRGEVPPLVGRMPPSADSIRSDVSYRTFQPTMGREYCSISLL